MLHYDPFIMAEILYYGRNSLRTQKYNVFIYVCIEPILRFLLMNYTCASKLFQIKVFSDEIRRPGCYLPSL